MHDNVGAWMTLSRSTPRVRMLVATVLSCIVAVAVAERPWLGAGLAGDVAAGVGFALVVVAALGRIWTAVFIAGFKDATLVRSGPYSACRHPLYVCSIAGALGLGFGTRSLTLAAVLLGIAVVAHLRAMRDEDARLAATYGAAAQDYREGVRALLPRPSLYTVPESLEVRPRVLWKSFLDGAAILLAWGLIQAAHVAQTTGMTPVLLRLP